MKTTRIAEIGVAYCAAIVVPRSLAPTSTRFQGIAAPVAGSVG
ncbi:hypothetical protein [Cellulomonas sp. P24]|nr:hypothetical protein [Cellulomonas sp. P24]